MLNSKKQNWGRWWAGKGKKIIVIRWLSLPQNPILPPQDNTLGSQIKYLRCSLGETRASFASLSGHPVSLISKYERNEIKEPSTNTLLDFAKALKVSPDKLISLQCFQPISDEAEIDRLSKHLLSTPDFGSKLRDLRLRANIGQTALAHQIGLNRESIRRYERNITKPSEKTLFRLVGALKASSKELHQKYYHNKPDESNDFGKERKNADK